MIFNSIRIKSLLVVIFFLVLYSFKPLNEYKINKENEVNGLWKNKDIIIELKSNQNIIIEILKEDGTLKKKLSGTYKIDLSKQPITIDIKNLDGVSGSLYAIIKINKELELVMSKLSTSWKQRTISFKDNNIIKFKKGNK